MSENKSVEEQILELQEKYADAIKDAQSQPGLREMDLVYGSREPASGYENHPNKVPEHA